MASTTTTRGAQRRYDELKHMLAVRAHVLEDEVHGQLRGVRADVTARSHDGLDDGELADTDLQDEIRLALIQLKAETLNKVNEALSRLDDGRYGSCHECGGEIAERRLRAQPFAVRCTRCEQLREAASQRAETRARRDAPLSHAAL
jgi:DnaK suppressor protein